MFYFWKSFSLPPKADVNKACIKIRQKVEHLETFYINNSIGNINHWVHIMQKLGFKVNITWFNLKSSNVTQYTYYLFWVPFSPPQKLCILMSSAMTYLFSGTKNRLDWRIKLPSYLCIIFDHLSHDKSFLLFWLPF